MATNAAINALVVAVPILPGKGLLSALLAGHTVLQRRQAFAQFTVVYHKCLQSVVSFALNIIASQKREVLVNGANPGNYRQLVLETRRIVFINYVRNRNARCRPWGRGNRGDNGMGAVFCWTRRRGY